MTMAGTYDVFLVMLSVAVAILSSFTALSLAGRIRESRHGPPRVWLAAAALALGGGTWAMHFVAMLAFSMPGMTMTYALVPTLASLAIAVAFTGAGLAMLKWRDETGGRVAAAGLLIAVGIVSMHYLGMAAMRMPAALGYDWRWVALSVVIALGAATTAVWLATRDHRPAGRMIAAAVMGAAIAGMHYTGMHAAIFTAAAHTDQAQGAASVGQTYLALFISLLTVVILLFALGGAQVERRFERVARREARSALRLEITDILRERDTQAALQRVAERMGAHFGVSRAGFADLDPAADAFDYQACWTDGAATPLVGRFPASAFGVKIVAALSAGETIAIDDLFAAAMSDEPQTHETAREVDTRAILVVPFTRDGRLRSIVYLNDRQRRDWRPDEIGLVEEIAERIRLVVERAQVEDQLRELTATLEARVEARTRELHAAEAARREADMLYRAYFEHTPDPLFVIGVEADDTFIVEQVNPAHEAGVGFRLADIRGKRVDSVLPAAAAAQVIESYRRVVEGRQIHEYREVFDLAGTPQHWDTTLVPLFDDEGRVTRIIGTSRNVTSQVMAEEAMRQSQKMEAMGQLTGGVAHDFNNLLTPILGSLDRLCGKGVGDERDRRLIQGALESAERARTLVQRLLSFARRQPLMPVPVDLSELVNGMAELIGSTTGPSIGLSIDAAPGLPPALADVNQLEMALLNLSVNARDAMPTGGELAISIDTAALDAGNDAALPAGRYLRLCVRDTGVGMDAATRRRAIEPFFSTKGLGKGTGLGLSMAHGLAAQLGGGLTIDSEPGRGTTICILLPPSQGAPHAPSQHAPAPVAATMIGAKVLLVDDDELVRTATGQMLCDLGYEVTIASAAEQALRLLEDGADPDLIVTDHLMPGMTGTALARHVADRFPRTRTLIITGYAELSGLDPIFPRLAKPFRQSDLAESLARLSHGDERGG